MKSFLKKYSIPIIIWLIFETVAISLFISTSKVFYLLNFTYIGTSVAFGISLMAHKKNMQEMLFNSVLDYICLYI